MLASHWIFEFNFPFDTLIELFIKRILKYLSMYVCIVCPIITPVISWLTAIALHKEQVNSVIYLCKYFSSAVIKSISRKIAKCSKENAVRRCRISVLLRVYNLFDVLLECAISLLSIATVFRSGLNIVFYDFSKTKMTGTWLRNNYQMWIVLASCYVYIYRQIGNVHIVRLA